MTTNICGVEYHVFFESDSEDPRFAELEANGYCECYAKEIHVKKIDRTDKRTYKKIELFEKKVLLHEIIHAVLFEAGQTAYYEDEKIVDTFALLLPKITEAAASCQWPEQEAEV